MAFDGITAKSIVSELNQFIIGGKINKIFEPNKNEIILGIYNNGKNYALNCTISVDNYRVNLTTSSKPNPLNAPNFCMLLRKHLIGGRIKSISMPGLERIIVIELECYNELNDLSSKKLVVELMGKHSNIILLNDKDIIIDSLRHLDSSSNSTRDILPAHPYEFPEVTKLDFLRVNSFDEFYANTCNLEDLDNGISNTFNGISKLFIQSILAENNMENTVTKENLEVIYNYLKNCLNNTVYFKHYNNDYTLTIVEPPYSDDAENIDNKEQSKIDTSLPYLNFFLDDFYTNKEHISDFLNYRNTVLKLVDATLKKITKKLKNINIKLKECEEKDKFQLYGELITANMYRYKEFDNDFIEVENYYDNNSLIKIPVNKNLSPSVNAKNYYKKYNKLKNALAVVNKQKSETIGEIDYIETIIYSLENAKTLDDIEEIYSEIKENDLFFNKKNKPSSNLKSEKRKNKNKKLDKEYVTLEYKIDNYTFFVGKNNKQNDYLSTKVMKSHDIWFHTKDIHGSHGVLVTKNTTPPIDVLIRCAQIVAYYSKARLSSNVPVDYTLGKYVKKPSGSKPGFVIYTNNSTINVNPEA
ncbi:MAG: NFACT family protein [Clostridia bacterium]|nr:NFACT family protein [Clostridia bacterium]MBR4261274.1 NFACT family protein [Clostridia bacterium]